MEGGFESSGPSRVDQRDLVVEQFDECDSGCVEFFRGEVGHAGCSELVKLGDVGHLNPSSGFGEWPLAEELIARLDSIQPAR